MDDELKNKGNADIQNALSEFEASSDAVPAQSNTAAASVPTQTQTTQKKEVAGISFETDSYAGFKYVKQSDTPKIITMVKNYSGGIIKEDKHAEYVLFAIIVLIALISLFLVFRDSIHIGSTKLTPEQRLEIEQLNYMMTQRPSN